MPSFKVTTKDGQEGSFDPLVAITTQNLGLANARVTGYDAKTKTIKAMSDDGELSLNVPEYAKSMGLNVGDLDGDFNDAATAVDSSPVSMWQRVKLGLANSEAGEAKTLLDSLKNAGAQPEVDARSEANQKNALAFLKKDFQDAKIVNNEYVVKKDGVWHKVDAPGLSAGDVAQFAAANGLNILGSIVGGGLGAAGGAAISLPAGGTGAVPGAMAGSAGGAAVMEAAEEALRIAIVGGEVNVEGAAQDILTEGLMGLAGEGAAKAATVAGKAAVKGAGKLVPQAADDMAKAAINGMKSFATKADPKVKDMVASLYGTIGPGMSRATTREMIESPETVQQALMTGKMFKSGPDGLVKVHTTMVKTLQTSLEGVEAANQARYGEMIEQLAGAADDTITLNLDETLEGLEKILKGASPEKRGFLDPVIGKTKDLIALAKPKKATSVLLDSSGKLIQGTEQPAVLSGPAAIRAMHKLKMSTTEKLGKLGAFSKNTVDSLTDADTLKTAIDLEDFLDSKILASADQLNLSKEVQSARELYGATKDALRPIKGKIFSEKMPIANLTKAAREEAGDDVIMAFAALDKLPGGRAVTKAMQQVRIAQAGIETADRWAVPKEAVKQSVAGAGAVATLAANPVMGGMVVGSMFSPRTAGFIARNLTSSGGLAQASKGMAKTVGQAAGISADAAAKAARMLTTRAAVAGYMHTLSRSAKDELLSNPESFKLLMDKAGGLEQEVLNITPGNVMDAAIKHSMQPKQQGSK